MNNQSGSHEHEHSRGSSRFAPSGDGPEIVLKMFHGPAQVHSRGSLNASATNLQTLGRHDALATLYQQLLALLKERPHPDLPELRTLDTRLLAIKITRRLLAQPELAPPGSAPAELQERVKVLRQLRSRKPSRIHREATDAALHTISETAAAIFQALDRAAAHAPFRLGELAASVRHEISQVQLPESQGLPITKLENTGRALEAVQQRVGLLSGEARERILAQLTQRAQSIYEEAIHDAALEHASEVLREHLRALTARLDELAKLAAQFARSSEAVRSQIDACRVTRLKAEIYAESSVYLTLPGPTESEVLAAMIARAGCGDRRELAAEFLSRLEVALRDRAALESPAVKATPGIGLLLTALAPETIAQEYERIFEGALGEGHGVYEIIARVGIRHVAQTLLERAEPLCQLSSRDIPQFNVNIHNLTIVRLPPPVAPPDALIRDRLAAAFRELCAEGCSILETSPTERDAVSVVRFNLFWPIVIESGNSRMLEHYARCEEIGHHPHLVGIVEGTHAGEPIPAYTQLAPSPDF